MVFVRDIAIINRPCTQCGRRVALFPDRAALDGRTYCGPDCAAAEGVDWTAQHGRPAPQNDGRCEVCGGAPLSPHGRSYGLRLCKPCRSVANGSCWRKERYEDRPARRVTEGLDVLWPYPCPLCRGYHYTSLPGAVLNEPGFVARVEALADYFDRIGFDLHTARGWTKEPRPRPTDNEED